MGMLRRHQTDLAPTVGLGMIERVRSTESDRLRDLGILLKIHSPGTTI